MGKYDSETGEEFEEVSGYSRPRKLLTDAEERWLRKRIIAHPDECPSDFKEEWVAEFGYPLKPSFYHNLKKKLRTRGIIPDADTEEEKENKPLNKSEAKEVLNLASMEQIVEALRFILTDYVDALKRVEELEKEIEGIEETDETPPVKPKKPLSGIL